MVKVGQLEMIKELRSGAIDAAEAQAEARDDDTTGGIIGSGLGAMIGGQMDFSGCVTKILNIL